MILNEIVRICDNICSLALFVQCISPLGDCKICFVKFLANVFDVIFAFELIIEMFPGIWRILNCLLVTCYHWQANLIVMVFCILKMRRLRCHFALNVSKGLPVFFYRSCMLWLMRVIMGSSAYIWRWAPAICSGRSLTYIENKIPNLSPVVRPT